MVQSSWDTAFVPFFLSLSHVFLSSLGICGYLRKVLGTSSHRSINQSVLAQSLSQRVFGSTVLWIDWTDTRPRICLSDRHPLVPVIIVTSNNDRRTGGWARKNTQDVECLFGHMVYLACCSAPVFCWIDQVEVADLQLCLLVRKVESNHPKANHR